MSVQEYLAHKKTPHPSNLEYDYAYGPTVALGGGLFLMGQVPLYRDFHVLESRGLQIEGCSNLQGCFAHKNSASPGPYSRIMCMPLRWSQGGAVFYERGTPVEFIGGCALHMSEVALHLRSQEKHFVAALIGPGGHHRGTSLIRNRAPLGPCSRPLAKALWKS